MAVSLKIFLVSMCLMAALSVTEAQWGAQLGYTGTLGSATYQGSYQQPSYQGSYQQTGYQGSYQQPSYQGGYQGSYNAPAQPQGQVSGGYNQGYYQGSGYANY